MSENKNTSQEIDLIELFSRMGNGIGNLFTKLFNLISNIFLWLFNAGVVSLKFGLKNSPIIILFAFLGFAFGKYTVKKSEPYFRTNATIQTFTINSSNLIEYTNKLTEIAKNQDSLALAQLLDINTSEASSIKSIEAFWLIDKNQDGVADEIDYENEFEPDTITNWQKINNRFLVQLLIYNPEYVHIIQDKFDAYLHTYPRLEQLTNVKKQNLESEIKRISKEIETLDSLKNYEYFVKNKELMEKTFGVLPLDKILLTSTPEKEEPTRLLHEVSLSLEDMLQKNISLLELETEPFRFISKFVKVNNPVNIDKEEKVSLKLIVAGAVLGILISLLIRKRKNVINFIKED